VVGDDGRTLLPAPRWICCDMPQTRRVWRAGPSNLFWTAHPSPVDGVLRVASIGAGADCRRVVVLVGKSDGTSRGKSSAISWVRCGGARPTNMCHRRQANTGRYEPRRAGAVRRRRESTEDTVHRRGSCRYASSRGSPASNRIDRHGGSPNAVRKRRSDNKTDRGRSGPCLWAPISY
jgi:hypothetical protein